LTWYAYQSYVSEPQKAEFSTTYTITESKTSSEQLQAAKLKELLYLTDDGYVKIAGADTIYLPAQGLSTFKFKSTCNYTFTISDSECRIDVPAVEETPTEAVKPEYYVENGELFVSYNGGEKVVKIVAEYHSAEDGSVTYVDKFEGEISALSLDNALCVFSCAEQTQLISVWNAGESAFLADVNLNESKMCGEMKYVVQIDEKTFFVRTGKVGYMRTYYVDLMITKDGGKTFEKGAITTTSSENLFYTPFPGFYYYTLYNGTMFFCGYDYTFSNVPALTFMEDENLLGPLHGFTASPNEIVIDDPYFEGDIGVWQAKVYTQNDDGERTEVYIIKISLDGGKTWNLYSPKHLVKISNVIEFPYASEYR